MQESIQAPDKKTWFPRIGGKIVAKGLRFPNKTKSDSFLGKFKVGMSRSEFLELAKKHNGFFV